MHGGAIRAIQIKEIEIINSAGLTHRTLARLILQANKLGFIIGPTAMNYIQKFYSPDVDVLIREFLGYKLKGLNELELDKLCLNITTKLKEIADCQN